MTGTRQVEFLVGGRKGAYTRTVRAAHRDGRIRSSASERRTKIMSDEHIS